MRLHRTRRTGLKARGSHRNSVMKLIEVTLALVGGVGLTRRPLGTEITIVISYVY
ncbi:MAG: hypothetical protein Kow0074_13850 [Candidatus Zixiibacteriota bacterium]